MKQWLTEVKMTIPKSVVEKSKRGVMALWNVEKVEKPSQ